MVACMYHNICLKVVNFTTHKITWGVLGTVVGVRNRLSLSLSKLPVLVTREFSQKFADKNNAVQRKWGVESIG